MVYNASKAASHLLSSSLWVPGRREAAPCARLGGPHASPHSPRSRSRAARGHPAAIPQSPAFRMVAPGLGRRMSSARRARRGRRWRRRPRRMFQLASHLLRLNSERTIRTQGRCAGCILYVTSCTYYVHHKHLVKRAGDNCSLSLPGGGAAHRGVGSVVQLVRRPRRERRREGPAGGRDCWGPRGACRGRVEGDGAWRRQRRTRR